MTHLIRLPRLAAPICLVFSSAVLSVAHAAEDASTGGGDPLGAMLLRTSLGLVVVLALIFALAWLARRWGGPTRSGGRVPMKVVGSLVLAPRERIVVVAVEDTWLVIGVSPGGMRTLHELPARDLQDAAAHVGSSPGVAGTGSSATDSHFLGRLQTAMKRRQS